MIKFIHRNQQFIGIVFLFVAVCFAISGVGLDILHGGNNEDRAAGEVNGQKLTAEDIARSERSIESRYRQMFGEQYAKLAGSLNLNIRQQAIDTLVDRTILDQEAEELGFTASDDAVRQYLLTNFFKGQNGETAFSAATYRNLLQSVGMSAPEFEREIKDEIARTTLVNVLRDVAVPSAKDAETLLKRQKTKFTVVAATVQVDSAAVPAPSETDLKKYYETQATEYETPAQVQYSYVVFAPLDFEKEVNVTPQDVEFYYSENVAKYQLPEQSRVRAIKLLYPKESDPKKMAAVRERADSARNEAVSGARFEDLVAKYSDDLPTKFTGGDLGWLKKGDKDEAFEQAVAKTSVGNVSELIETDYGFEIIKVEERKASQARPLHEVRAEIEKELRKSEAPAYAANRAREVVLEAKKEGKTLAASLPAGSALKETNGPLPQNKDPEPTLVGLTQNVFMLPTSERLQPNLIDLGDATVLVQVQEFKEPSTPPFEEVKDKVVASVRAQEARKLAETKANEILKAAQADPATFTSDAQARGAKVVGPFEISREESSSDKLPTMTSQMRTAVLSSEKPQQVIGQVFPAAKEFTLLKVEEIKAPNLTDPKNVAELTKYRAQASQQVANNMITSTLELLKSRSQIEIDPSLIAAQ
jgi:peptidyl-prolyl cis-trans isomerase D